LPFFAGFYSKDIILEIDWVSELSVGKLAFYMGMVAAILTAFYSWRLLILTFHGTPRADEAVMGHIHESPLIMLLPLIILAIGSVFSGYVLFELFVGEETTFWGSSIFVLPQDEVIRAAHHVSAWIHWSPTIMALLGIWIAYILYVRSKSLPEKLSQTFNALYTFLWNKWYFDELYDWLFVDSSVKLGKVLWEEGDEEIIDGLGPNGLSALALAGGGILCRLQTGYIYHYAFAMIMGMVLIIGWYFWL